MAEKYDIAVLGGGPGGYVAAIRAAKLGQKTALIERDQVGGTCLNRGCIPTKSLLQSAHVYEMVRHAASFGVHAPEPVYHFKEMAERKDSIVGRLRGGVEHLLNAAGVDLIRAVGTLMPENVILAGDRRIEARRVILAMGSEPVLPPIPGAELPGVMTSDGVLALKECPSSVAIVGGGVIGMEFAALFQMLNIPVTVLEAMDTILTGMDSDVIASMTTSFRKRGIRIHTGVSVREIRGSTSNTVIYERNGEEKKVDAALVILAAGRRPLIGACQEGGVHTNRGRIVVDEYMRTNLPGVYAIGDCTGRVQLAHVASAQALVAVHHAVEGAGSPMRYDRIPSCVYTTPEIACVGLTEEAAAEQGYRVRCGSFPVSTNGKSMVLGESEGFCKLVTDADTGEILGAHMIAPHATDMIGEIVAVLCAEGTVEELAKAIHPHPTVSEIIMEAAHDAEGSCCHKV